MFGLRLVPMVLVFALFCFSACDEDDPPTGSGGRNPGHSSFPSSVGMLWKYEVYDSLTETVDTVWVSVTEEPPSIPEISTYRWRLRWQTSGEVEVWNVTSGDLLAPNIIDIVADTAQGEPRFRERFVMPFADGAEWTGDYWADTSRVSVPGSTTVPAGTFTAVARVDRDWNRDFEGGGYWSETWLDEGAGIIKRHFLSQASDGANIMVTRNETWELVEYDLTTFDLHQFPNTIGTQWVYQVTHLSIEVSIDTVGIDTVAVTIIGTVGTLGPDSLTMWEFAGRVRTDTSFVSTRGNIVTVRVDTAQRIPPLPTWSYEFPMAVGKHWGIDTFAPGSLVSDKGQVSTPAGSFQSTFSYAMSGVTQGFWSWRVRDWLAPGVGVVQRSYSPFTSATFSIWEQWSLLSFRVADQTARFQPISR